MAEIKNTWYVGNSTYDSGYIFNPYTQQHKKSVPASIWIKYVINILFRGIQCNMINVKH
jgi:hypothetical protein